MTGRHARMRRAHLTSAYHELGKQLLSKKLLVVGQYTLERTIGQGTYGKVRMATHRLTNERVAVKQIHKQHIASLTREIHHHRRLHHPHVLQLYEVILTESHIWMVTELCSGGELYDVVAQRGGLPESEACIYFGQLCLALAYIHEQGIVHRDLKLENILLDADGRVKLSDFGFTREFEPHQLMNTRCGTQAYSAPEMLDRRRYVGEKVDIWSMGVILYALVCGSLPFDDDNDAALHDKILHASPYLPPTLSPELSDLLRTILAKNSAMRPSLREIVSHPWFEKHTDFNKINYLEAMSAPSPPLMESFEEQHLFQTLQELGLAVGQIRHSVLTHACDSAGAFWWLLLHCKRRRTQSITSSEAPALRVSESEAFGSGACSPQARVPSVSGSIMQSPQGFAVSSTVPSSQSSPSQQGSALLLLSQPASETESGKGSVDMPALPFFRRLSSSTGHSLQSRPASRSSGSARRCSMSSLDNPFTMFTGSSSKAPAAKSRHGTRRRRDSESNVYRLRKSPSRRLSIPSMPHTPLLHGRCMSMNDCSLDVVTDQAARLNIGSTSRTELSQVSPSVMFLRRNRSPFKFTLPPRSPALSPKRQPLSKHDKPSSSQPGTLRRGSDIYEEDDWIDEECEFVGGLGQKPSTSLSSSLLLDNIPFPRPRRGSPSPLPAHDLWSSFSTAPRDTNTASLRRKTRRGVFAAVIEEEYHSDAMPT